MSSWCSSANTGFHSTNGICGSEISRPFGTENYYRPNPNVETLGYCRKSLRDWDGATEPISFLNRMAALAYGLELRHSFLVPLAKGALLETNKARRAKENSPPIYRREGSRNPTESRQGRQKSSLPAQTRSELIPGRGCHTSSQAFSLKTRSAVPRGREIKGFDVRSEKGCRIYCCCRRASQNASPMFIQHGNPVERILTKTAFEA
jgi:hypothetical protein